MINGIIILNKDDGPTSFQAANHVKKLYGSSKAGHLGTLDAHATGVLVVCLGLSTKLIPYMEEKKKSYKASFRLGVTSNTFDVWGHVQTHDYNGDISEEHIKAILANFAGKTEQVPPMFSAKKVNGVRLYELALEGLEISRKTQTIEIFKLELLRYDQIKGQGEFELECSKGTYVRSLISDIGKHSGYGAIMTSLTRLSDADFPIHKSHTIAQIEELNLFGNHLEILIPPHQIVSHLPEVAVGPVQLECLYHGNPINIRGAPAKSGLVRINSSDKLIGIGKLVLATGQLMPERML